MKDIRHEVGWVGVFTRNQIKGALRNGTRIIKVVRDPGEAGDIGALGTVLGSIGHPTVGMGYFIEWDSRPKHAVFTVSWKVAKHEVH